METLVVKFTSAENTLSYKYIRMLRLFLWVVGAWPGELLGEQVPAVIRYNRIYQVIQCPLVISTQVFYIYSHSDMDFSHQGYCYLVVFLACLTLVRLNLLPLKQYGELVRSFLMIFHLGHSRHEGNYNAKVFNTIQKISNIFTVYFIIMTYIGMFLFSFSPLYLSYKSSFFSNNTYENTTFDCIICLSVPGIVDTSHFTISGTLYTVYLTYPTSIVICGIDLLLTLMAFQIIGHILILRNNLESLPKPKESASISNEQSWFDEDDEGEVMFFVQMYDKKENETIYKKLVDCVNYYRRIVTFTTELSNFFGPVLGVNYAFQLLSCCLLLLECSQGSDAMLRFGPLTAIIFGQLILLSVIFEIVATVSEKLKDSVYFTPWEYMNTKNRRTVQFMLTRMQRPINITAMGLAKVGVTTMASIIKTTISFFTLLRSVKDI